ncbi:ROK family transcriptional regulator [Longispora sp. NPDC051575]|uniref:ROK family transcriptional regulator n=1 Tax=Longispora sp. NPDC051575 TaxID=3154943 RepID=UPI0034354853
MATSRHLRALNEGAALEQLLARGSLTRGELRELTGLSKPTASELLRRLVESGLAVVTGHVTGRPGPNAEIYAPHPEAAHVAAISLRVKSLSVAICDLVGGVQTEFKAETITEVLDRLAAGPLRPAHIQLAVPGSYDPATDTIRHIDTPGWDRPGLIGELRTRVDCSLDVDNDVNLVAVAERQFQNGPFTLLWVDEGLGLAIDLGGQLLRGASGGAGEIGYLPVPTGARGGDLQSLIGAPNLDGLTLEEIAERLVVPLVAIIAIIDPPRIVLAGSVARAGGEALREAVEKAMALRPFNVPVELTKVDGDPVLTGALRAGLATVQRRLIQGDIS